MTEPTDSDVMNNFARMVGPCAAQTAAIKIPGALLELGSVLDDDRGVVDQAVADDDALHIWTAAGPEARSAILLNLARQTRAAAVPDGTALSPGGEYAIDLHSYAREFSGDAEAFHGRGLPEQPLLRQAGALATSIAFDRDERQAASGR